MKKCTTVFLILVLLCICTACEKIGEKRTSLPVQSDLVRDSILKLDSLASLLIFKDNTLANIYVSHAIHLSNEIQSDELLIKSLNIKGRVMSTSMYDSAFYYYNTALAFSDNSQIYSEKAYILYNLSRLYYFANDYKNTIILLDSSIRIGASLSQPVAVSASLIALGNIFLITEEYQKAKDMYDSALHISMKNKLYRETGVAYVNLAQFQGNNDSVIAYLRKSLFYLNRQKGTEEEQVNAEINLAMRLPDPDSAIFYYQRVINKANEYHMPIELLGAYNNIVYKYLKKGKVSEAEMCIRDTAIPLALEIENYDWLATLYDTYSDILIRKREFEEAINYLRKSIEARAISDRIVAEKQVRILNAVLELNNKNLQISEKERLLIKQNARIAQMNFWLAMACVLVLSATGIIFWVRQRAKSKLQLSKLEAARKIIEAEEHEKERNAMELHDSMNLLIAKVSNTIQRLPQIDQATQKTIEQYFSEFSADIRNISHRLSKKILEQHSFHSLIKGLCADAIHYSNLNLTFHISEDHKKLPVETTIHLIRIIQELLTNARKYAPQAEIKLIIRYFDDQIELVYSDDGPGFDYHPKNITGMGFSNIFARVNLINGQAEVDSEPGQGMYWKILAPIP
ncbi:MAG: hypothetical protein D4R67_11090 [Bacteroidetes bacterium]|nr:MAG: hypothetical protein D4R67_11090 [Bacteroidota bacterium]